MARLSHSAFGIASEAAFGGVRIVVFPHWPKVPDGFVTVRVPGHPLVYALSRLLARIGVRLEPDVVWDVPRLRDAEPTYRVHEGTIYCSPRQEAAIRQELARANAKIREAG